MVILFCKISRLKLESSFQKLKLEAQLEELDFSRVPKFDLIEYLACFQTLLFILLGA